MTTRLLELARRAALAAGVVASLALSASTDAGVVPVGTAFTYQGQLRDAGGPVDGIASFRIRVFDSPVGGAVLFLPITICDVALVDGLFTVELDFGANVFDGSERWLDIAVESPSGGCANFVPLSPRQPLRPTPYALRSLAPWKTSGSDIFYADGDVGIGTATPDVLFEIEDGDAHMRLTSTANNGTSLLDLKGDSPSGFGTNALGSIRFLDDTNAVRAEIVSSRGLLANAFNFVVDGTTDMVLSGVGNLGVGTTLPLARLQVDGGSDSEPDGGGYVVIGSTTGTNLSFDNNEIMARNNGATATLFLNNNGGDVSILPGGFGQVGIGTPPTAAQLTVFNSLFVDGGGQPLIHVGPDGFILMDTGADIILTGGGLEVNTTSAGSTFFNRVNPDGTLVGFRNDGTTAGSISVIGSTVVYGTFTGAHNGWTDVPMEAGTLVSLTGALRRGHSGPNCEPTYGIAPTAVANDPRCGGSYVCPPDPADATSHHLFAAVGNGEMWVVDAGLGNIAAGDALISSDVVGAAMKDDPARFAVGHVVARAAEPIDWATVPAGPDGVRRALLSVFYDRFDRHGDAQATAEELESLRAENDALRARLDAIEAQLESLAARPNGATR